MKRPLVTAQLSTAMIWMTSYCLMTSGQKKTITIGALFEHDHEHELTFELRRIVDAVNQHPGLLPPNVRLVLDLEFFPSHDSFAASRIVCRQLLDGVAAILGPMRPTTSDHVQSICDAVDVPHIRTHFRDTDTIDLHRKRVSLLAKMVDQQASSSRRPVKSGHSRSAPASTSPLPTDSSNPLLMAEVDLPPDIYSINVFPSYENISQAFVDFAVVHDWSRFTIVYDSDEGLLRVEQLLRSTDSKLQGSRVVVRYLESSPTDDEDFRPILKEMRNRLETRIILDCHWRRVQKVLAQDSHLIDLEAFKATGVNLTAFRLMSRDKLNPPHVSTSNVFNSPALIANISARIYGVTGSVEFDQRGRRSTVSLDLVELSTSGLETVGSWEQSTGLLITRNYSEVTEDAADILRGKMLMVTTLLEEPYVMLKKDVNGSVLGNDSFEGFCVDLLDEISQILKFNYTLRLVEDGLYGAPTGPRNEWNGMVRELIDKKADLAVAALTISYLREDVIDFTKPFMNLGISILFKKPERKNPGLFSFLSPLSFEIWIYMIAAYLAVSFTLFVLARFSPYEWYNPHPCNPDCDVVENQFTLINSLWFCVGSLMQQGSEVAPRAISTRMVSGIWWFFTLILISSYTANLAAFLTTERMKSPIESAEDLARQNVIKYGALNGGSTMTFFKTSKIDSYNRMWKAMQEFTPNVFVNSTTDGIERVRRGQYALLLESRMIEYITQRQCDLMQVGGLLDSKGYGIGTPRGSPYRDIISDAILKLQEDQMLQMMYDKWWKETGDAGHCDAATADDKNRAKDANALAIDNVGGVFVVLAVGLTLSPIVAVIEFVWKTRRRRDGECSWSPSVGAIDSVSLQQQSICSEMCAALNFAVRCSDSTSTKFKVTRPPRFFTRRTSGLPQPPAAPASIDVIDPPTIIKRSSCQRQHFSITSSQCAVQRTPQPALLPFSAIERTNGELERYTYAPSSIRCTKPLSMRRLGGENKVDHH